MADAEIYQGTSLRRGVVNPGDDGAQINVHVTGLDGSRSNLNAAIVEAISGRLVHPDNSTLPLRTATAQWHRGADNGDNAEAIVTLLYGKNGRSAAESSDFSVVADVSVRYITIPWYASKFPTPTDGYPEDLVGKPDPDEGNANIPKPTPKMVEVPVWRIAIPVTLSSSPVSSVAATAGTVNDTGLTLSDKTFAAGTLRFDGLDQRVTRIDSGSGVTYEFDVRYVFSYREDTWQESVLQAKADGTYQANVEPIYESPGFPTFPA